MKLNIREYKGELSRLINQVFYMNSHWGMKFENKKSTSSAKREKAFAFILLSTILIIFLLLLLRIFTRNEEYSYYKFLCNESHWFTVSLAFFALVLAETVVTLDFIQVTALTFGGLYVYCISTMYWLKKICSKLPEVVHADIAADVRKTDLWNSIPYYRGISILTADFNVALGRLVIPFIKLFMILCFVISFTTLIRLHKHLDGLSLAMIITIVWTSTLDLFPSAIIMSKLYDISNEFFQNTSKRAPNISDSKKRRILQMQVNCCQPIRCCIGSLYYMEAKAKLTLVHQVVNGVAYLLVNLKI